MVGLRNTVTAADELDAEELNPEWEDIEGSDDKDGYEDGDCGNTTEQSVRGRRKRQRELITLLSFNQLCVSRSSMNNDISVKSTTSLLLS